jgi:hypothetical protein
MTTSTNPFSTLEIHRSDRDAWKAAPTLPGIYLLYGFIKGEMIRRFSEAGVVGMINRP